MDQYNPNPSASYPVAQAPDLERANFIRKTYLHVALAVLTFIAMEFVFFKIPAMLNLAIAGDWCAFYIA